ncbi:DUF397 domain-containing protein [Streptomyces sp. JJ66]|uniref:DUF397 domain-containing protein n=1 Tax=Streptomyces sp. JJ66 TaxID=2803843 RepID=UPI001C55D094|nr:DUF397 domain-containing protein [Streptomyces sp. JJ66]MBW1602796.1 DUF397 domain-containing protein [Streptomyces sp. JJ66]
MRSVTWQKSSYSAQGSNCVELASASPDAIYLRESDDRQTVLVTTPRRLAALLAGARAGTLPSGD